MPLPRNKKNATKKRNRETALVPSSYVHRIDGAEGWEKVVDLLCEYFKIPNLNSRFGLKRVHSTFDAIWDRLDAAYTKYATNLRIRGGIVGIYAKMCPDAVLRNRLFKLGVLSRILPLLHESCTHHLALQALSSLAHHATCEIHLELAKLTPILVQLLEEYSDNPAFSPLIVTILCHCLAPIQEHVTSDVEYDPTSQAQVLRTLDMNRVLKQITRQMQKRTTSYFLLSHCTSLLLTSALPSCKAILANPSSLNFFIAGLRSLHWQNRGAFLSAVLRLFLVGAEEDTIRMFDPRLSMARKRLPDHLERILADYGFPRSEQSAILSVGSQIQSAMFRVMRDRDLCRLGQELAGLIMRSAFFPDGICEVADRKQLDVSLPFTRSAESLPRCAQALRQRGGPHDLDNADVLEIRYNLLNNRLLNAAGIAEKGLARNSEMSYFFYAIERSQDNTDALRSAKKGLKCKQITPFLRLELLYSAAENAAALGLGILEESSATTAVEKWEEGIAFIMSAWKDSKTFIAEAPPDNRHLSDMLYWHILLTIVIRGPDMSADLKEIKPFLQKLSDADDFRKYLFGIPICKTQLRRAQEAVVTNFAAAIAEWDNAILWINSTDHLREIPPAFECFHNEFMTQSFKEDLELNDGCMNNTSNTNMDSAHQHSHQHSHGQKTTSAHPNVNTNNVVLYECSWCGNPSAVLRKCSGCGKARYCDASCQKLHWSTKHKTECKV
ncbi:hypothetical protein BT96DRAFT_932534 [Gymnopus androsaceus JB14]|uniref:MYND-type domain-containing protein n=1 Tax=Gymnopus androsaceus JB14 TaxID=1447944 RepID=A0A6A4IGA9_9AGAR|nr:hypothetical protein BT96DRAFT_932534 [Gymnopus androsaceus JB14]